MNIFDRLFRSTTIQIYCSGFGCNNLVTVNTKNNLPEFVICRACEKRMNEGITASVHAHTSKLEGSYNIFDEILH